MSILQFNGGDIIAMAGKNCVAIAADTRLGMQQQTVACDFQKVFKMTATQTSALDRFHLDNPTGFVSIPAPRAMQMCFGGVNSVGAHTFIHLQKLPVLRARRPHQCLLAHRGGPTHHGAC